VCLLCSYSSGLVISSIRFFAVVIRKMNQSMFHYTLYFHLLPILRTTKSKLIWIKIIIKNPRHRAVNILSWIIWLGPQCRNNHISSHLLHLLIAHHIRSKLITSLPQWPATTTVKSAYLQLIQMMLIREVIRS